jgi:hypothetical protein
MTNISRRDFLKVGGGILAGSLMHSHGCGGKGSQDGQNDGAADTGSPADASVTDGGATDGAPGADGSPPVQLEGRVVHVHSPQATNWDFGQDYYGQFVDQSVVNTMVDEGIMELTSTASVEDAWRVLIPDYAAGRSIAIKVNFNNASVCGQGCETGCGDGDLAIDALIHPINSVVRGLSLIGVAEQDIRVYDATQGRSIPGRFTSGCLYANVQFCDQFCNNPTGFTSNDPDAQVTFTPPGGIPVPPNQRITDVVIDASYLINIPIVKMHGAGVTLCFKNHFGTIDHCSDLHEYILPSEVYYTPNYNPMVDIYRNPHIVNKTVLSIGDALFGHPANNYTKSQPWTTFGNGAPNSLFFAADPVAVDCVMCDLLAAEGFVPDTADDYLVLAEAAGLGTFERGDPWQQPYGSGYSTIQYIRRDI